MLKQSSRKGKSLQQMVLQHLGIHMGKQMNFNSYLTHMQNLGWIIYLNLRATTINLLEEKHKRKIFETYDVNISQDKKAQILKQKKIDKLNHIKIKSFCFLKGHDQEIKRQATYWEKTFSEHKSHKSLVTRVYKELQKSVRQTTQLKNRGGMNWEIGINIYTLLCIKQITNENLLYSTGNSTWCSVET